MYYPPQSPYYGQVTSAGAIAGGATAAASGGKSGHLNPEGALGLDWKSIMVAVMIGSVTAVLTQLTLEHVKEKKKQRTPKAAALVFSRPWDDK
jgi:hypothetical protein